jgi:hypothetical protein
MAPMHVNHAREVPEYEIDPKEIDFTDSVGITKVKFSQFFCILSHMGHFANMNDWLNQFAFKFP